MGGLASYAFALTAFGIALGLRFVADPYLPPGFPFLTFFPAVIVTAFLAGLWPGILVGVLSFFSAWYFFLPPTGSFDLNLQTAVALGFFASILAVVHVVIESLMRSQKKLRNERMRSAELAEQRDTLFRELQHRIGNNLQAISALLSIQARSLADPQARASLQEATTRISTVADIQRMFNDPNRVEGQLDAHFVEELARKCLSAAGVEDRVDLSFDIAPVLLPQEVFLPVALVLTECINNAIEHAVQAHGASVIGIALRCDPTQSQAVLSVVDNGPGPPKGFEPANARSIGMMVIAAFARQIGATFKITRDGGTRSSLAFRLPAPT